MEKLVSYFKSADTHKSLFTSNELELFRKLIHSMIFIIPFLAAASMHMTIIMLCYGILFYVLFEGFRIKGKNIALVSKIAKLVTRPDEDKEFVKAPLFLAISTLLVLLIFPLEYASIGIFSVAFGDTAASLVGRTIGGPKLFFSGKKTISGSLACFLIVSAAALRISGNPIVSIFLGFIAATIEALSPKDFDNLLLPILTAGTAFFIGF